MEGSCEVQLQSRGVEEDGKNSECIRICNPWLHKWSIAICSSRYGAYRNELDIE